MARQVKYDKLVEDREIKVGDSSKLVVSAASAEGGVPRVDIRTWIESDAYSGPTKKGVNVDCDTLDELIEVLSAIRDELNEI